MEDRSKDDFRRKRAEEAAAKNGNPSHKLKVFGVTGTNGKTTSTFLIEWLMKAASERCAVTGTVENRFETWRETASLTTPGPDDYQKLLAHFLKLGATAVASEVSSHGLDQFRVWPTRFEGVLFTNLTQDHLDYHGNMENYYQAKRRLFFDYEAKARIINADDTWGERLIEECQSAGYATVSFGRSNANVNYEKLALTSSGIRGNFEVRAGGREFEIAVNSPLVGEFNAKNLAQTAALGVALGYSPDVITRGLNSCPGVPGRLEAISEAQKHGFSVFVDYAHTPDALEKALKALKPHTKRQLVVVFGCGGDRDSGKRPLMAKIAEANADKIYVTSDNPRTENPDAIIKQITQGLSDVSKATVETDRESAIHAAIHALQPGDILLIAGKGHEDYQIIGTEKRHFDDREVARAALSQRK